VIGLDANVLVRFITGDDPAQSHRATQLIEQELTAEAPGYVNLLVLAETAWALRSSYGYSRDEVADEIRRLLEMDCLLVSDRADVFAAVSLVEDGYGEFPDALISQLNKTAGCARTVSFDRRARRLPGFEAL
jgi:predicted nucleic-acid-binding protein